MSLYGRPIVHSGFCDVLDILLGRHGRGGIEWRGVAGGSDAMEERVVDLLEENFPKYDDIKDEDALNADNLEE